METKLFEIRDRATFIPVIAIKMVADTLDENYLLQNAGYFSADPVVRLMTLTERGMAVSDPYDWNSRTLTTAHDFIQKNFDFMKDGEVVDVEFILGETTKRKKSQKFDSVNPDTGEYTVAYE